VEDPSTPAPTEQSPKDVKRMSAAPSDWESAYRQAKSAWLKEQEAKLEAQGKVDEKNMTIHALKVKLVEKDTKHAEALNRLYQAKLDEEGKVLALSTKLTHKDKTINQLEMDKDKLKARIQQLELKHRSGSLAVPHKPSLVPEEDQVIRSRDSYKHPEAPRTEHMYRFFTPSLTFSKGTGKVWPSRYGSNGHWDLGLCQEHFNTLGKCQYGDRCEYRHAELTPDERLYMSRLGNPGIAFLTRSTTFLEAKRTVGGN
jgi:hypothetical protein